MADLDWRFLKTWRAARDWGQKEVARRSGLHRALISNIETNTNRNPSLHTVESLARAFGVTVDDLRRAAGGAVVELPPAQAPETTIELPAGLDPAWVRDFLEYGHRLTPGQRKSLLRFVRSLANEAAESELPEGTRPERPGDQRLAEGS